MCNSRILRPVRILASMLLVLFLHGAVAQQSRRDLERKRNEINRQIQRIRKQLRQTSNSEQNALQIYRLRQEQINYHERLIANLQDEIRAIERQTARKNDTLKQLQKDLEQLKIRYAEGVRKAYKFSNTNQVLYFILSADNFQQAFRRMRYLREYTDYIRRQAKEIEQRRAEIERVKHRLQVKKHEKENMLTRLADEKRALEQERRKQETLLAQIRKQKSRYIAQIKKKQREARRLDREIQKLIAREIARRNKARGKSGRSEFVLTPQGKALARSFAGNKGHLPWPVKHGYVSQRFGVQPHPVFKNLTINSSGIYITTPPAEKVYAIFRGEVMMIQVVPGGNTLVYIRHGNYISIYGNLTNVQVKTGQKVEKGQWIGNVGKNPASNTYVLKFRIYQNTRKLNPLQWLARK